MRHIKFAAAIAATCCLPAPSAFAQNAGSFTLLPQSRLQAPGAVELPALVVTAQAPVSPSAPDSDHDATTVSIHQMLRRSDGPGAPRIGHGPTATEAEQNATTVPRAETRRRPGVSPAPRSGVNPSAPD